MAGITLHTARQVVPMIYAYTTPEIARHNGWTKTATPSNRWTNA